MTAAKIRQSEFAEKHGLKPGEVKSLRDKHLVEGTDFWSEVRAIFWTEEAAARVHAIIDPRNVTLGVEISEKGSPSVVVLPNLQARIIKPCNNKRFVYANLNGVQITVNVGNTRWQKLKGKNITVRKNPDSDSYTFIP